MRVSLIILYLACCVHTADLDLVRAGIGKVFDKEFDEARIYIEKGLDDRSDIRGFLAAWIAFMEKPGQKTPVFEKQCQDSCRAYERAAQGADADSLLLGGMWQGLMALYLTGINETLAAYRHGTLGCEMLRKALFINPARYDAYYGLGLYYKMRYELAESLWFVPSSKSDRDHAKKYLGLAWSKGEFTRDLSAYELIDLSSAGAP